jgi:hypothetical protein
MAQLMKSGQVSFPRMAESHERCFPSCYFASIWEYRGVFGVYGNSKLTYSDNSVLREFQPVQAAYTSYHRYRVQHSVEASQPVHMGYTRCHSVVLDTLRRGFANGVFCTRWYRGGCCSSSRLRRAGGRSGHMFWCCST